MSGMLECPRFCQFKTFPRGTAFHVTEAPAIQAVAEYCPSENPVFLLKLFHVIHRDILGPCGGGICVGVCTLTSVPAG